MAVSRYSNEEIINILKDLSRNLGGKQLTQKDVATVISVSTVRNRFGNLGNALESAGLERNNYTPTRKTLTEDELFLALFEAEIKTGNEPKYWECRAHGKYSVRPYWARYGKWDDVLVHYRKWKIENKQKLSSIIRNKSPDNGIVGKISYIDRPLVRSPVDACDRNKKPAPVEFYGEPLDFRGLRHAPINEQGVVFLFAMVSRELGFNVESMQQGFPDCEAKYLFDPNKNLWARARLEFEYKASTFKEHNHDPKKCDFIVCWIDDWPDCPLNVIELKTEITKLPNV